MRTKQIKSAVAALFVAGTMLAACSTGSSSSSSTSQANVTGSTTWLCAPQLAKDPCNPKLQVVSVPATGASTTMTLAKHPGATDCFYVYPTVSKQLRINATLAIEKAEINVAADQAGPFSSVCTVYAPMYRQVTVLGLAKGLAISVGNQRELNVAYDGVLKGFEAFLASIPPSHHFVLLGHSQGATMLIRLIAAKVDPNPALRARLVSAILLGGNLTEPNGKDVGAAFKNIPLCSSATQNGCAVAYSSFLETPPTNSFFGIPGQGVSKLWNQTGSAGLQIACVDPSQLLGVSPTVTPLFPNKQGIGYFTYPGLYTAGCQHDPSDNATWLQVNVQPKPVNGNSRPLVSEHLGKIWGTHLDDVNLTQGDLLALVAKETGGK
jgi:Protein of unknown function (DUF3089)